MLSWSGGLIIWVSGPARERVTEVPFILGAIMVISALGIRMLQPSARARAALLEAAPGGVEQKTRGALFALAVVIYALSCFLAFGWPEPASTGYFAGFWCLSLFPLLLPRRRGQ